MNIDASEIIKQWTQLCHKQTESTERMVKSFVTMAINNDLYVIANNDSFTFNASITFLLHKSNKLHFVSNAKFLNLLEIMPNHFLSRRVASSSKLHMHFIIIDHDSFTYARKNECRLIRFSSNGIFDYTHLLKKWAHLEPLVVELHKPDRVRKWIESGNNIDDYLM